MPKGPKTTTALQSTDWERPCPPKIRIHPPAQTAFSTHTRCPLYFPQTVIPAANFRCTFSLSHLKQNTPTRPPDSCVCVALCTQETLRRSVATVSHRGQLVDTTNSRRSEPPQNLYGLIAHENRRTRPTADVNFFNFFDPDPTHSMPSP